MHKLSYYTVISDPVTDKEHRVIYSTRSGEMLEISKLCFDFITNGLANELPEQIKKTLIDKQMLVPEGVHELEDIIAENHEYGNEQEGQLFEVIQPSAMCQLGCYYCGQKHTKDNLSDDLVDKLVDRIYTKFKKGNYQEVYIGWFGAEPLMGLPQMREIYQKLEGKIDNSDIPIKGKIVTNGLSLKPDIFVELATKLNIDTYEITLDGIAKYHDTHRYTKKGGRSFDIIYNNLKAILSRDDYKDFNSNIIVRVNVDVNNVDGVEPLIKMFAEDDIHKNLARLYFIGIYSWAGNDAHKKSLTREEFSMKKMKWELLKIKLGYPPPYSFYSRKKNTCIATGGASELYDAHGNIFNCTEVSYTDFYNDKDYKLGNLKTDHQESFKNKPHNDWFEIVRDTDAFPCHSCKLLPICGGCCPKSWTEGMPACPSFKYSIVKELELRYLLRVDSPMKKLNEFENNLTEENFQRFN